ncbi:MAG: hypothetical protein JWP91_2304 [Fibrobacteres bacterium]|nr:hypothetical protein [Fibrobacterota bacterium]
MDEARAETVGRVFREVLERQAFLFADPAEGDLVVGTGSMQGTCLAATMAFRGAAEGGLSLIVPESLAGEIATNFLGLDASEPATPSQSRDCLKELLNVTCGHILTSLQGEEPVFDLSIPEVGEVAASEWGSWSVRPDTLVFQVDDSAVLLTFHLNGPPGAHDAAAADKGPS